MGSSRQGKERRLAEYEKEFSARQREYSEFFARRIAELEKQAAEERSRAASANEKLKAVAAAIA